ncbi:Uncharacterized protein HZ326_26486 [Fusarium oxysporum f. sp. albedinis]|nr:Uncharacterized protein HZ326_26486 [Fusarium oxysporum f. sp. albedinis]
MGTRSISSRVPFSLAKTPSHSSWSLTSTACAVLLSRTWIIGAQRAPFPIIQANSPGAGLRGISALRGFLAEESTAELEVVMNNETRWNSTYMMIERALRKQTDITAFLFAIQEEENEARRIPADDILSSEDWRVLGEVNEILKLIYLQTMRTQGWGKGNSHGCLWGVLIEWNTCWSTLRTRKSSIVKLRRRQWVKLIWMPRSGLQRRRQISVSATVGQAAYAVSLPALTRMRFTRYRSGANPRDP